MSITKALIVDDEPVVREEIIDVVEGMGHSYEAARHIQEARYKLENNAISYVLLDMTLPARYGKPLSKENGVNFLREIKAHSQWGRLPVIMVTGTVEDMATCATLTNLGASGVVFKPLATAAPSLQDIIHSCLERQQPHVDTNPIIPQTEELRATRINGEWLQQLSNTEQGITWKVISQRGVPREVFMKSSTIACKILSRLHRLLPARSFVSDADIMDAGGWSFEQYYGRGNRASKGISRNRLTEIKQKLGIDYRHIDGGVEFFRPE